MYWPKLHVHTAIIVRIILITLFMFASSTLIWYLLAGAHLAVHASSPTIRETTLPSPIPWGVSFDASGNVWVAEPGCDPTPICSPQQAPGNIAQYNRQNFSLVQNYAEPGGYAPPLFLAVDTNGAIWFTEPSINAIGELMPNNGNPTWKQYIVPTPNASPYDLTFDQAGNLWFTEFTASKIGEFNPATQVFTETPTPTPNSNPYGIVGPDSNTGAIWFTENNSAVSQIGRFTPPLSGTLSTTSIDEYLTKSRNNSTPHLITFDHKGNIWWTEGFDATIGSLAISQAVSGTSNGVAEYPVPQPQCASGSNCGSHISGIAVDSAGTVWFDDSLSSRIGSYVPTTGTFTMTVIEGGTDSNAHPHDGLAVDASNTIWFTEEFADKLGEVIQNNVPTPTPTPPPGSPPVNKTWYFGEGRIGGSFNEYLTLGNPDAVHACAVNVQYLYTIDGSKPTSKTLITTIPPNTRATRVVNTDLGIQSFQVPAASVSAFLSINSSLTPDCNGIVAERPMYFSNGIKSGHDVLGATHTGTTFYFADVPTGGGYSSYFTILNPGSNAATVTAAYYANGQKVNSQILQVPAGARGTISPNSLGLPRHVAAIVTSDQPVVVERPDYFSNVNGGNAGIVSGGTCIVGAATLASDWLFAEGFTGAGFQEYFVIANLDSVAKVANATIKLEYQDGSTLTFQQSVNPNSQVIWNVNQFGKPSQATAAEITSTGANIIVQRVMYFRYSLEGVKATAVGGTDVIGQVGPASSHAYSFAEGYTNTGFNEWLTLENPTNSTEKLFVTLVNGAGRVYTQWVQIGPSTRSTLNITALVLQHLVHADDGGADYEVSIVVQSLNNTLFVAERPMYWNVVMGSNFPTQGGTDIIGYTGL
ncbi:MAG TPA: hypothetical protein DDW33_11665 [Ktedonobacter sp.]|nr:hypothetical protein [Ktedonobacter sp.]HAT47145.1 hypothetical protein [Ktedonobacter sp.]HBE26331.1 hypothetical protein [Ktedonobacter sp.]HBE28936.1 hypothetical protein [Ktedonobacter sp.]HCF87571.1 hypothetical protein [Ktedonobacter sp.]